MATKADVASVEDAVRMLRAETQQMEQRLDRRSDAMVTRLGALVVVAGLLFAALHNWPPHS